MPRRRYRKKSPPDIFTELLLPIGGACILLLVVQYQLTGVVDTSLFASSWPIFTLLLVLIVMILSAVALTAVVKFYFAKIERDALVRKQKYINDWFSMDPQTFEHFVAGVYEKRGYTVEAVTSYVADHGIDIALSKGSKRYAVQVKRYKNKAIGEKDLREFYGSYISQDFAGGTFLTTSYFTGPAKTWAKQNGMLLVDGDYLVKMVNNANNV